MKYTVRTTDGQHAITADAYVLDDQGLKLYRSGSIVAMFRLFEWFRVDEEQPDTGKAAQTAEDTAETEGTE